MARLKKNTYEPMPKSALKDPIVFVIDMINGFIYEGALHDEAIGQIIAAQQRLMDTLACRNVFVCDSHPPQTREFQSFPSHCVIGTREADIVDALHPYVKYTIHKNSTNAFAAPEFQDFLKDGIERYQDIIAIGCCTDLCVLQFALSLQGWLNEHNRVEHNIVVPVDCVETYHTGAHDAYQWNDFALRNMEMNGIQVVATIA